MAGHYYDHEGNPRHDASLKQVRAEDLLISVTTYLDILNKPGLNKWRNSEILRAGYELLIDTKMSFPEFKKAALDLFEERNQAHKIGTATHDILEQMIKEQPDKKSIKDFFFTYADPLAKPLYDSIIMAFDWQQKIVTPAGLSVEETIVNIDEKYAGQLDGFGLIKDPNGEIKPGIIDWKTQGLKHPGFSKRDPKKMLSPKINKYDTWPMQMGAYAKVKKATHGYIGVISTNPHFPFFKALHYTGADLVAGYKGFKNCVNLYNYLNKM